MKRWLAACMVMMVGLVGATAVDAAIKRGTFKGTTERKDPVGFKVDLKGRVHSAYFSGVRMRCSDGDRFDTPTGTRRIQVPKRHRFRVSARRTWSIRARNRRTGFGWDMAGRFNRRGNRARGTLSIFARFNEQNQQARDGSIRCRSGKLTWSARRR